MKTQELIRHELWVANNPKAFNQIVGYMNNKYFIKDFPHIVELYKGVLIVSGRTL